MKRAVVITALLLGWVVAFPTQSQAKAGLSSESQGEATEALFDLSAPPYGPFPSDWFTVPDASHNTGLRINLPKPSCVDRPFDCEDLDVINQLDGFNVYPRLSIPFSGPIDLNTVGRGVFLIRLGNSLAGGEPGGQVVGIDQVVFEPTSNTLYVESGELLDQHTRYLLLVTKDVLDASGKRVKATTAFLNFVDDSISDSTGDPALDAYRALLRAALTQVDGIVVPRGQVVAASVFSTQSATAVLEKIRDQIHSATPAAADFLLGPNGGRTVFKLNQIKGLVWNKQTQANPPVLTPVTVKLSLVNAVDSIAFGKYISPDYEDPQLQYIPPVGTRTGTPAVQRTNAIYFNLFLPPGPKPANGWPVEIFVHGFQGYKDGANVYVAANAMAKHGIATLAISDVGHGFGALSTLTVVQNDATTVTFYSGGRSIDQNGNNIITSTEGIAAARPKGAVFYSDAYRQTAADLMQLVRVIEVGIDVDGDGQRDVDPSRIYLFTVSLGGGIGTLFAAVEPNVRLAVLNVPFDPIPGGVWGCFGRNIAGALMNARQPALVNWPGIKLLDNCPVLAPWFNENFPLREQLPLTVQLEDNTFHDIQSPVTNSVPGAIALQEAFENLKWVGQAGSPLAYAPHLRKAPLDSVPPKSVLLLTAYGDQAAPNPTTTAIARAGDLADRTLYYRHDLYRPSHPLLPANPHGFAVDAAFGEIAVGVQDMVGNFFFWDGFLITPPQPSQYFEFPILTPLPEKLNYLQ